MVSNRAMTINTKTLNNVRQNKVTTGVGLAMIVVLILKLCGVKLEELLGLETSDVILYLGSVFASILLLFSRDP